MVGCNHFHEIKKDYTLIKNDSLGLNIVPYKEKKLFLDQLLRGGTSCRTSDIYDMKMKITGNFYFENLKMSARIITFYLSRNFPLKNIDVDVFFIIPQDLTYLFSLFLTFFIIRKEVKLAKNQGMYNYA